MGLLNHRNKKNQTTEKMKNHLLYITHNDDNEYCGWIVSHKRGNTKTEKSNA